MHGGRETMMKNYIFAHRLGAINCNLARSTVQWWCHLASEDQNHGTAYLLDGQYIVGHYNVTVLILYFMLEL